MKHPKFYIGPMSLNVVDAVIEASNETNISIGLIPSRRQIDFNGGYSNKWKTKDWAQYVRDRSDHILLERDHGGPIQGLINDYGFDSFYEDCKYMDLIHVDPWRTVSSINEGIKKTIQYLSFCYETGYNVYFEIGTEESIFKYEADDLDFILSTIKHEIPHVWSRIKYVVIQSGTAIKENVNIGNYSEERLKKMIDVCQKYHVLSKEHNGDYLSPNDIKLKFSYGLDAINIAPEFGVFETDILLNQIFKTDRDDLFQLFYQICYDSKKWEKWVSKDFNPVLNKQEIIRISGHYVFSHYLFSQIKNQYPNIDTKIKNALKNKINNLLQICEFK